MKTAAKPSPALRALARCCGIAPSYLDFDKKTVHADPATLIPFINRLNDGKLSADATDQECVAARRQLAEASRSRGLPPVLVAWDGKLAPLWVWSAAARERYTVSAQANDRADGGWSLTLGVEEKIIRDRWMRLKLATPPVLPPGYYQLEIKDGETVIAKTFVISAPEKLANGEKSWGAFASVYALRNEKSIGDFGDLKKLCAFIRQKGGAFVGTLPLLAADYEANAGDVSPYAPSSRLFWNEIYLDVDNLPTCHPDRGASAPSGGISFTANEGDPSTPLRSGRDDAEGDLVDYATAYAAKKKIIMDAATEFFTAGGAEQKSYQDYKARTPLLDAYTDFRAKTPAGQDYHRYAQYACDVQLQAIKTQNESNAGAALYLDYPVGVSGDGFDATHFRDLFLHDFQVGAPPDLFYAAGQNWGFQPLDPRAVIADHFNYLRAALHVYFARARMVRLDHVMGFYRLYCIPAGEKATEGAYIYYPFEALTAILCLEAHRHNAVLIGEDLGTVPDAVRAAMDRHHFNRMWLLPFEAKSERAETFAAVPPATIASFNTHDMFPYAAYRSESDIAELERLSLIGEESAASIRKGRVEQWKKWRVGVDGYNELLQDLAQSPARYVMINIEDLWRETEPQNIPGTTTQYPNWRRRFRYGINAWKELPGAQGAFDILQSTRSISHG